MAGVFSDNHIHAATRKIFELLTRTEAGLSCTPCGNDIRGEHLNIFAFPVLFLVFLVKPVFSSHWKSGCEWRTALNNLTFMLWTLTAEKVGRHICCEFDFISFETKRHAEDE